METLMRRLGLVIVCMLPLSLLASGVALAADDSKVKAATHQVKRGAKKIPEGKVGEGVKETAKGVGKTVTEGAKYSGNKVKEAVK
jgi:hypothetical protein